MITYLTAFIFYTMAMVGILLVGFVVYKKVMPAGRNENKGMIKILDSMPIGAKKALMVVKIRNEKFLIASGLEHTTFLAKLNDENTNIKNQNNRNIQNTDSLKNVVSNNTQDLINSNLEAFESNEFKKQNQIDELQQARLQKLQRQFNDLYNKKEEEKLLEKVKKADKQKLIKQLLKELNSENSQTSAEDRYING